MTKDEAILLSTAYFPPVQYISKFTKHKSVWIEATENFTKQTYRNRTIILGANGTEALVVPVVKGKSKQAICDLKIAYDTHWQHTHWQAIVSAYNSSPFFEILADDFKLFFKKKFDYLLDLNMQILDVILNILEITPSIRLTDDFEAVPEPFINFREAIHPKSQKALPDLSFKPKPYTQVFEEKFNFVPNLSILDLLFNCGSESYSVLLESCV